MKFEELARYLEKLEGISSRNEMTVVLAELLGKASVEEIREVCYMTQGKLGPAYRSPDFGVADKQMTKALGIGAEEIFKQTGDLGKTIYMIKDSSSNDKDSSRFSVIEVYEKMMKIAQTSGAGSQEGKLLLIAELLKPMSGLEAKYAVKIILGKLRSGFSDMTVLDALSWMLTGDKKLRKEIEDMYNVRADLGEIAEMLKKSGKPKSLSPKPGTPVLMAKCERAIDPHDIWERNGECAAEYKMDGLRIQAHVHKDEGKTKRVVTLFSRGLENVTSMYPDICGALLVQMTKDCIVEGEMIALDKKGNFLPFQETMQRKRKHDINQMSEKVPLSIFLFEVLWVDGLEVMLQKNEQRRKELESIVGSGSTVRLMPRSVMHNVSEIEEFFNKALNAGCEGIVAKKFDSPYQAGSRDFSWIKYKKSYDKSAMSDTVDAVVMGYDVGQGKRSSFGIGDFLIGVYDKSDDKYKTIAKIGTGLSDEEWIKIKKEIDANKVLEKPEEYEVTKQMVVDVWSRPNLVVEVMADEVTKSPMHTSGFALRFPRLVAFREKKPQDSTSIAEFVQMYSAQKK